MMCHGVSLASQAARLDIRLNPGRISETIEVKAEAPLLNTENAVKGLRVQGTAATITRRTRATSRLSGAGQILMWGRRCSRASCGSHRCGRTDC